MYTRVNPNFYYIKVGCKVYKTHGHDDNIFFSLGMCMDHIPLTTKKALLLILFSLILRPTAGDILKEKHNISEDAERCVKKHLNIHVVSADYDETIHDAEIFHGSNKLGVVVSFDGGYIKEDLCVEIQIQVDTCKQVNEINKCGYKVKILEEDSKISYLEQSVENILIKFRDSSDINHQVLLDPLHYTSMLRKELFSGIKMKAIKINTDSVQSISGRTGDIRKVATHVRVFVTSSTPMHIKLDQFLH